MVGGLDRGWSAVEVAWYVQVRASYLPTLALVADCLDLFSDFLVLSLLRPVPLPLLPVVWMPVVVVLL